MSTVRLLDRFLFRFLGVPLPGKPTLRKHKTITPKPKVEAPKEEVEMTYGSNELSAFRYNAPQLVPTKERLARFEEELKKEKAEEEAKYAAGIKTYKQHLEDLKHQKTEFNGLGLTSEKTKRMAREWEAEQKRALAHLKVEIAYAHSPIKTCSN